MVQWSWINFQVRGILLVWIRVGQGPTALAVGAGGGCLDIFTLISPFSFLSPSLWETTRYRLKYCLKESLSPQTTNQPTSNPTLVNTVTVISGLSDHDLVLAEVNSRPELSKQVPRDIPLYKKADWDLLKQINDGFLH